MQQYTLELINKDRAAHGVSPVVLGNNPSAQMHAEDMLFHDYQGHWWANGMKPYMVYTVTGGKSYASENAASSGWTLERWREENCHSFLVNCIVPEPREAIEDLQWSMMYDDAHANWGHRHNILDEGHRAVNIGVAFSDRRLTFIQHFEGGDLLVTEQPILYEDGTFSLSAFKVADGLSIGGVVSIYYDPPPVPMTPAEIDALDSYCIGGGATTRCGDPVARVLQPPEPGRYYTDLEENTVVADVWNEDEHSFHVSANIGHLVTKPGVYTITVWKDSGFGSLSESLMALTLKRLDVPAPFASLPTPPQTLTPTSLEELREYALQLINGDRTANGIAPLALGDNPAAQLHAEEMVEHDYFSTWWLDGRSTYMVYSATGGANYVRESIAWNGWREEDWQRLNCDSPPGRCKVSTPKEVIQDIHTRRMSAADNSSSGHRENILDESHRLVNFGVAYNEKWVVFVQHFEGGDVEADSVPGITDDGVLSLSLSKKRSGVNIAGSVGIYYDPFPTPKAADEIDDVGNSCTEMAFSIWCGDPVARVFKPPDPGWSYDLDANEVVATEWDETEDSFTFQADLGDLAARPGVYTVVVWRDSDTTMLTGRLLELSVVKKR